MDTKQYKIKSGKVTFASPVPHLICTNGAWVQISANSKGKARAHVRCGQTMDLFFLFTLDLKRKTRCLTLLRIDQLWHAVTQRQTGAWMSLTGQWMDRHTLGGREGGGARPLAITHLAPWWKVKRSLFLFSTTTNSTLIDQVVFVEMHLKMADRWNESIFKMITDPTTRPTLTPPQCLNGFRVDGHLWGQKGTNGYSYVLILPRMMQKCIPALRVISMACSYSGGLHVLEFSHSLYCPGLEDKRKRDWVLLYNKEDQENKVSLILFLSLGALIAYCNRSHPHSRNNQQSSHSCHSRHIRSLAVRSHSSGCIPGSSSCCNLDSSSGPGLETTGEAFVTTLQHTGPRLNWVYQ